MSSDKKGQFKRWLKNQQDRLHPLTHPQRELWEASSIPPSDTSNHVCAVIRVRGDVAVDDWQAAMELVIARQEALRISILPGKSQPIQLVHPRIDSAIRLHDLPFSQFSDEAIDDHVCRIMQEPFDFVKGPLFRSDLIRRSAHEMLLVFTIHHAIFDGWSIGVLVQDLSDAYAQVVANKVTGLARPPMSYFAWGRAERAFWTDAKLEQRSEFWTNCLGGAACPWSKSQPDAATCGKRLRWAAQISEDTTHRARQLARRTAATFFSVLLTAFNFAWFKWTGTKDIVVGTPVAQRSLRDCKQTIGYFSGIVPIVAQLDHDVSFGDSVRTVHEAATESFANAIPFVELVQMLPEKSTSGFNPIFGVRFALQNHPMPVVRLPGIELESKIQSSGTARFELACEITEQGDALEVVWLYRPNAVDRSEVKVLHQLFCSTLSAVCK